MFGKKKIRYDYDADYDGGDFGENSLNTALPPPAPITKSDVLVAFCLGAVVVAFAWLVSFHGVHPSAWKDLAVGAGLRAPDSLFPGLWRIIARAVFGVFGVGIGCEALAIAGKVSLGVMAFVTYLTFRAMISLVIRKLPADGYWNRRLARISSSVAAFAFVCSDPIWSVCQAFTSSTFLVLLFLLTTMFWVRFYHNGRLSSAYMAMLMTGILTAESPIGILLMAVGWSIYSVLFNNGFLVQVELVNTFVKQNSKWPLTFFFVGGLLAGIAANVLGFIAFDGLAANALAAGDLPVRYAVRLWHLISGAATAGGWIIGSGLSVMPFVLALTLVNRATDVEYFLKYQIGLAFFAVALAVYSQMTSLQPLWFWTWIKSPVMVRSPLLLAVFAFMMAVALLCSLAVLWVDVYCRNNRTLAEKMDPDGASVKDDEPAWKRTFRPILLVAVVAALVAGVVPGRIQPTTNRMLGIMRDYVRETVDEAGDAKWLFTDGSYDCALELESARRGGSLTCVSLLPGPYARSAYALQQIMPDAEDRLSAEVGGPNLLRTWERDKPERLAECAFQLGFELWRRSGKAYPPVAGVLARVAGKMSAEELDASIKRGYVLAEKILSLYTDGGPTPISGAMVNDLFLFMQWRLARLARVRAEIFDVSEQTERSLEEVRISDALDDQNESLKRIIEGMTRLRELTMRQMTPREGLQFALVRADFALARRYAEPILDADPDDPNANFGMGMSYFMQEQFGRAEEYLTRCLKRNSKEPAIWNNIAVLQLRTGRLDEAKKNAEKALSLIPDSAEVKDTLAQIERAIAAAATNGVGKVESTTNAVNKADAPAKKEGGDAK